MRLTILLFFISCNNPKINYPSGGLPYPKTVAAEDSSFDIYQYRDSLSTYDSIMHANYSKDFLTAYDEPNLSIGPQKEITFRLVYEDWLTQAIVMTLTRNRLVIKQKVKGHMYRWFDKDKLNDAEKVRLSLSQRILERDKTKKESSYWRAYLDSSLNADSELGDPAFYQSQLEKIVSVDSIPFAYSTKVIYISDKTFIHLVNLINESGFWSMPRVSDCNDIPSDAGGFALEANMPDRYKIVSSVSCPDDLRKFTIACNEIVRYAGMKEKANLVWDGRTVTVDSIVNP